MPAALDAITLRALDRNLDHRYADAACMAAELEEYLRERRFSPESAVKLLDDLFGGEDSARELPLIGESVGPPASVPPPATRDSSPLSDSVPPPASPISDEDDTQNDYATVSAVHKMAEIAGRHRRRRVIRNSAMGLVMIGAMAVAALYIPGVRLPNVPWGPVVAATQRAIEPGTPDAPAAQVPQIVEAPSPQAGIEIHPATSVPTPPVAEELRAAGPGRLGRLEAG